MQRTVNESARVASVCRRSFFEKGNSMKRILAGICAVLALSFIALGQSTQKPAFEIADVHQSPPSVANGLIGASVAGIPRGGRYELQNATMLDLIMLAYNVTDDRIVGGPNWLATDRFDVV